MQPQQQQRHAVTSLFFVYCCPLGDQIVLVNDAIVLGLPFPKCLDAMRSRRIPIPTLRQQKEEVQLEPIKLDVYRGPLPLLYGAPGLLTLQKLDAVKDMLGDNGERHQKPQHGPPVHVPAGSLRALLQTSAMASQQLF